MQHTLQTANILLMLLGGVLVVSGPIIIYKTLQGMKLERDIVRKSHQKALNTASNALNFVIAVVFSLAGVLFILNNLRGNPLS